MATNPQRLQSIGDALLNKVATQGQIDHLARALAYQDGELAAYQATSNNDKAAMGIALIRKALIAPVRAYDAAVASKAAGIAADEAVTIEYQEVP